MPELHHGLLGEDGGEAEESHRWMSLVTDRANSAWRYRSGNAEVGMVEREPDGSFGLIGIEDLREKALTRYKPAEPLLIRGIRVAVSVYDPSDVITIVHEGTPRSDIAMWAPIASSRPVGRMLLF